MRTGKVLPKIVLVSDDKKLGRQLRGHLSALGLAAGTLVSVRTASECLMAVSQTRPCLLVLDDSMTKHDSPDLLRTVRQHDPEVLVVYLATHHTAELERAVRQLGVLYYTEKPPDPQLFGKILSSALASAVGTLREEGAAGGPASSPWGATIRRPIDT
ncbi:MAG: response regulator [Candidatus Binatia bacterium]|nr:response regulator [Candidatus Binatia bacterium]